MGPALLLWLALSDVPPPLGVNETILGTAESTKTVGPARICLIQTSIDLEVGETAYLEYLGIHWGGIRVVRKSGEYLVREGNAWARPHGRYELMTDEHGRKIIRAARPLRYLIFSRPRAAAPRVLVEGMPLVRTGGDRILERITIHHGTPPGCSRRFIYGWVEG